MDKRYTIPNLTENEIHRTESNIKRSLFICSIGHSASINIARTFIENIKKEFPDATHNCWAFACGPPADTASIGFSDDGEPHGTAGRPILNALLHSNIGELVCVVTRYFGGVKLGTGGLVRAYQGSALECLTSLPTCQHIVKSFLIVQIHYAYVDKLHRLLIPFEGTLIKETFTECASFTIDLPKERTHDFVIALNNATDGSAKIEIINQNGK